MAHPNPSIHTSPLAPHAALRIALVLATLATLALPGSGRAQEATPSAAGGLTFGPRVEIGYAFDASRVMAGAGAVVEVDAMAAAGGRLALTVAATQFVILQEGQPRPWTLEGGVLWSGVDRRSIIEISVGSLKPEEGDSEFSARAAIGREYGIDPGRALRVQVGLRLLGSDEVTLGLQGTYPFRIFD